MEKYYCDICEAELVEEVNFIEQYVCPVKEEPWCDTCLYQREI